MNNFDYSAFHSYIKGSPIDNQKHVDYLRSRKLKYINLKEYEHIKTEQYKDGYIVPMDKVINIFRSNHKDIDERSLYDLLKNGHHFRHSSLHDFFENANATSLQSSIDWLKSTECAFSDLSAVNGLSGELPSASYFEDVDKFFINTGQNRAFAGLLIGAEEYRVESISYYRRPIKKESVVIEQPRKQALDNSIIGKLKKWLKL
ncbi:hypothetical protein SAMN05421503_1385 [Terribacillus aidingensis]|uniref:Uncharacterized protein n=1 Tax=Terribacillus aidingensis TaxID=586416 RepID=A0A285NPS8_9BACI|nr:hypothetical protein [Terribacillus aidingensis]SNZ09846.1 hypothetical protein SAMN05421503_1385 [Terribacillus aidingensis]